MLPLLQELYCSCVLCYVKGSSPHTQKGAQRYNDKLRNPNNQEMSPHQACPRAGIGDMSVPLHHNESMERFSNYSPLDVGSLLRNLPGTRPKYKFLQFPFHDHMHAMVKIK